VGKNEFSKILFAAAKNCSYCGYYHVATNDFSID
jgi:hypothetical protein